MVDQTGLITQCSRYSVAETAQRFRAAAEQAGLTIFAEIDHRRNAEEAGMNLRPTLLLIFGAARGGTPLMQLDQVVGIDLPLKALVWQDDAGTTWLSYNDPAYLARRHGLGESTAAPVNAMSGALKAIATKATTAP